VDGQYAWDEDKHRRNLKKHGIGFDEAETLFTSGVMYLEIYDVDHSDDEDRFICIGPVSRGLILVVIAECGLELNRIISARLATPRERMLYQSAVRETMP
jgi:uncharacterized DUF497 family protein